MSSVARDWSWVLDLIGFGGILAWIGLSTYSAIVGDYGLFQRLGSAGVAAAVAYFALVRHTPPYPIGLLDRLVLIEKQAVLFRSAVTTALSNTGILAVNWIKRDEQEQKDTSHSVHLIAESMFESDERSASALMKPNPVISKIDEVNRAMITATQGVETQRFRSGVFEAVVVFFATLQWGFGDCFWEASACSS